jgi:asparagine synthase (glutamine-hydrolysing)
VAVSLSGGLDSSAIFCLAETLHRVGSGRTPAPVGLSYLSPAGSASDEREFLLDIERQYGVSIRCVPVRLDDLIAGCRTAVWHLEVPFLDSQWPTLHTFHRRARELGVRVMLTGHWGDQVLFPQAYLVDLFRQLRWREIHAHLQAFERWMASVEPGFFRRVFWLDLVKRHLPARWIPYLRQLRRTRRPSWYTAPFRRLLWPPSSSSPTPASRLPTVHAQSLYDEARSFYHVQCMEWENKAAAMHGMDIAFPFLDRDLLSFLMRIPGDMQTWQGTPKALLREGLKDVLPERIVNRRWKADFTRLANAGLDMDFPRLVECLQDGSKAAAWGFLDRNALTAQLPHLKKNIRDSRTCETTWELTDLLGLELWLQVFFGTRPRVGGHAAATIEPGNMPAYRCKEAL